MATALEALIEKPTAEMSYIEYAIKLCWVIERGEVAEAAIEEFTALRDRVAELETEKERIREAVKMARVKLQSTQINWQEECLFQCNDLLGIALDVCPSCTWRGDVSLQDGICPYCKTNWHALRGDE